VINNVDDALLISLAVNCDKQYSAVGPVICGRRADERRWPH